MTMQIPTYEEMLAEHSKESQAAVELHISAIIKHMRANGPQTHYTINNLNVRSDHERLVSQAFLSKGWVVRFNSDQRDGEWISILRLG